MESIIREIKSTDKKEIVKLFHSCFSTLFPISEEILERTVFESGDYCAEASFVICDAEDGKMIGCIATKVSRNQELYPDTGWITLLFIRPEYRRRGLGSTLYEKSQQVFKEKNIHKVFIGQDLHNLFSGIPSPNIENENFFRKHHFWLNPDQHYDLQGDVQQNPTLTRFDVTEFEKEFYVETMKCGYEEELLSFLEKEFLGRWEYEAQQYLSNQENFDKIVVLRKHNTEEIVGYCMLSMNEDKMAGLGPIGIGKEIRGRHVGNYILRQALLQLRTLGAIQCLIDWTVLKDFYGQFGFKPIHVYRSGYKEI
ncbi:GNAT family N-acetyltransferase [Cellulosilyticum sp. ST5]|uniref:GNAT family N-acetyltransferase n=1 Tax=unclassified Cellulosilyticum TaxID=2643091 RepID=UPI000F8DB860|nr:GNAT family N-acetyltransferase [Cellulosilyticum sp. WCF-2]QEH70464.1 GNAT family N-acetyltransferase [Cellulosilyticum sp. WCF-2]